MNGRFGEKRKIFETLDGEEIWKGEKILRIRNVEYREIKERLEFVFGVFGENRKGILVKI